MDCQFSFQNKLKCLDCQFSFQNKLKCLDCQFSFENKLKCLDCQFSFENKLKRFDCQFDFQNNFHYLKIFNAQKFYANPLCFIIFFLGDFLIYFAWMHASRCERFKRLPRQEAS